MVCGFPFLLHQLLAGHTPKTYGEPDKGTFPAGTRDSPVDISRRPSFSSGTSGTSPDTLTSWWARPNFIEISCHAWKLSNEKLELGNKYTGSLHAPGQTVTPGEGAMAEAGARHLSGLKGSDSLSHLTGVL